MTNAYVPFIDDPQHLRLVNGERYAVLRPTRPVVGAYSEVQARLRDRLAGSAASFPAYPHVTLRGWPAGTELESVRDVVRTWAKRTGSLRVQIERIGTFPSPYQIVVVLVRKTDALREAFSSLIQATKQAGLPVWPEWTADPAAWQFHMSVAYCSGLDDETWQRAASDALALEIRPVSCEVTEVEIAAFDASRERSGAIFALEATV